MVKLLNLLLIIFGVMIISSCGYNIVPKHVKQNFTYCYDGFDTILDTQINIEGYYDFLKEDCSGCHYYIMFYKDGIYVSGFYYDSMQSHFEYMVNYDSKALYRFHKYNGWWGCYIIDNDTIKLQTVHHPAWWESSMVWWLEEVWYKILDENTIIGIYPSKKPVRYPENLEEKYYMRKYGVPAKFTPLSVKPDSNCWLKREKWFWCNENDWKHYMDSLKQNKRRNK